MIWIAVAAITLLILLYIWSSCLLFYHEEAEALHSDESKCFDEACRSIIIRQGSDKAVLMIHGYPTTPAMYSYAAERMKGEGYDVYAPLIPSFGADWHDFEKTVFSSWYGWMLEYYDHLAASYSSIYVIGTSMGGAMALKIAEERNNGKKHRKSRWPACASAAAASFLLCACGGGGAAAADPEDISLYDRGLAVIDIMAEMTESEAYIGLTTANDGIRAIIQNDLAGEHEEPEAVYSVSIPEEQLWAWWDMAEMEETGEMSQELRAFLRGRDLSLCL